MKARVKAKYAANRESELAKAKAWAHNNKTRRRAYIREWNNQNRDKVRRYRETHKARKRGAPVADFTARGWALVQSVFRNRCAYCGATSKLEQDHVVPVSKQGWHSVSNIVPSCRACNAKKCDGAAPQFHWCT